MKKCEFVEICYENVWPTPKNFRQPKNFRLLQQLEAAAAPPAIRLCHEDWRKTYISGNDSRAGPTVPYRPQNEKRKRDLQKLHYFTRKVVNKEIFWVRYHLREDGLRLSACTSVTSRRCRWRWQRDVHTVACRWTQTSRWRWVRASDDCCRLAAVSSLSATRSSQSTGSWYVRRIESRRRRLRSQRSCFPDWQARRSGRRVPDARRRPSLTG